MPGDEPPTNVPQPAATYHSDEMGATDLSNAFRRTS
jgi:hypothetical protein